MIDSSFVASAGRGWRGLSIREEQTVVTATSATAQTPHSVARLMRLATNAAVVVAVALIVAKLAAWLVTDSISMLSTLIDSALDALASLVNLLAVRHALQPADREHRFGHGKAEAIAGLTQAAFIIGSAMFLIIEAGQRFIRPEAISASEVGLAVMVFSIVASIGLVALQRYVVAKTKSAAIAADSLHYVGDLFTNVGVIVALELTGSLGWLYADPIIALAIAAVVVYSAWGILRGSYNTLMDHELPNEQRQQIRAIATAHAEVLDLHDLRTRASGRDSFIQFHLVLPASMSLQRAHEVADEVEANVRSAFPGAEVIIHQDPEGLQEGHSAFR
ncbi:MAG: cation diffusion facilitator family transporter [Alphaproteobacteria bacterium]|nr:cation diffusion facilitator family transporter [Alphaproteobacteria bacterium]